MSISTWFGLTMTLLAFWVDVHSRHSRDYAFWLYLFGVLTFWGGLSSMNSDSELNKLIYCGINVAMILIGASSRCSAGPASPATQSTGFIHFLYRLVQTRSCQVVLC